MAKIFITGSTGFVGKRLVLQLLSQGHEIYALSRIKGEKAFAEDKPNLYYIWGDLRNPESLTKIPKDIDAAYYLVHSMSKIVSDLVQTEVEIARSFLEGIKSTRVQQIIYLGGIINDETKLSMHLRSRLLVEKELQKGSVPVTILRSSIIIGSGGASFEIIRDLCEKLPVMIAPKWVHTKCQPIAIRDVIYYLSKVLLKPECYQKTFDIGGPEVFTFKELMLNYCKFRHLKRWIIDVPFLTPRLSSYWLVFITSVRLSLCSYLVESMKVNTVVQLDEIQRIIPHKCITYLEALELAFKKIASNQVDSTWMDAWEIDSEDPNIDNYVHVPQEGSLKDVQRIRIQDSKEAALNRIWAIGGETGYYTLNWAWRLRGFIDQMIGGIGLNRGRRHPTEIQAGDSIDFWRVILADKENSHLILFSDMKVPGEAWLEFRIEPNADEWVLKQTATFRPRGLLGRLYWFSLYLFHVIIFHQMAKAIAGCSKIKK